MHHLALSVKDLKKTIRFYEEALGMKLRSIFPMHGVLGAKHCFMEAGNGFEISFVEFDNPIPPQEGVSQPRSHIDSAIPWGGMVHMAYQCTSLEHLRDMRNQVSAVLRKNYPDAERMSPILDHDFCASAYFRDPENGYLLELCTTTRDYRAGDLDLSLLDRKPELNEQHTEMKIIPSKAIAKL